MPSQYAIEAKDLQKFFKSHEGQVRALDGVSFEVPRGVVFAILGPNGAGKTTLLRILTTMSTPDGGTAFVEGHEIGHRNIRIRKHIGVVAQENHFDKYLSIWNNLVVHAEMHGMARSDYEPRISELLEMVNLYHRRHDSMDELSGGMQRRLALIRALIHRPSLLFLDEPTTGLDPSVRIEIWKTIEQLKHNTTVILTTHYMEEADRLSDRIMIMSHGKVMATGTPAELKQRMSMPDCYHLQLLVPKARAYAERLAGDVREATVVDDNLLSFHLDDPARMGGIAGKLDWSEVQSLGLDLADLETVYLSAAREMHQAREHRP